MPVEDSDTLEDDPVRRMNGDFAGEVADQAHIVIAEHDLHGEIFAQQLRKEREDDRTEGRGEANDRVLYVARDDQRPCTVFSSQTDQSPREGLGGSLGRAPRTVRAAPEAEMQVRDDNGRWPAGGRPLEEQRRLAGNRAKGGVHGRRSQLRTITLRVGSERVRFDGPERK